MGAAHSQVHFPPGAAPRVRYGHTNVHTHMQTHARTDTHTHTYIHTNCLSAHDAYTSVTKISPDHGRGANPFR